MLLDFWDMSDPTYGFVLEFKKSLDPQGIFTETNRHSGTGIRHGGSVFGDSGSPFCHGGTVFGHA